MFAYLLIILELTILASAYWYVFVREPKPFEIKENIWGYYDQPLNVGTGYGVNGMSSDQYNASTRVKRARRVASGHVLLKSRHGVKRKEVNGAELRRGWIQEVEDTAESKPSLLGSLLAFVGDKLTQLSVKV
jgi:hypothetical protein